MYRKYNMLYLFFPCVLLVIVQRGQANTFSICYNSTLEGFRLNTTVLMTKDVNKRIDCVIECATEPCCRSINYIKILSLQNEKNCEMLHNSLFDKSEKLLERNSSYDHIYLIKPHKEYNESCFLDEDNKDNCEFTSGSYCYWVRNETQSYHWKTYNGKSKSNETGPNSAYTTASDYYLYAEAGSANNPYDKAVLTSKHFRPSQCRCISWNYHMFGSTMGNLSVYVIDEAGSRRKIWSMVGDQGNNWISANTTISNISKANYQVEFEAIRGPSYLSDIALDDIFFKEMPCGIQSLGCFKDSSPKDFPTMIVNLRDKIDWKDMKKTIRECACAAYEKGYKIFAVQFYGECWGSESTVEYHKLGPSEKCWEGVGTENINFVYKFIY